MMLDEIHEEDYLVYTDAGAIFVNPITYLLQAMERENTDIMAFCVTYPECWYTKMDAFLLMECNDAKYMQTFQNLSGYIIIKKTDKTIQFLQDFLHYVQDERIVTDMPNQMGVPNHPAFRENRHDQSCFSLLCKKYGIPSFRDPSQFGLEEAKFPEEVKRRSNYPQVINSFRDPKVGNMFQLKYGNRGWYKYVTWMYYKAKLAGMKSAIINGRENERN